MDVRSLSRTEARVILSLEAEGGEIISLEGIRRRASVSPGFARKLAHDLMRKGWLHRVRRGTYLLNPGSHGPDALPDTDPFRVGSRLTTPYYFGFATAAELEGLLPQASHVYYLVTTSRPGPSRVGSFRFRYVHSELNRFFGTRDLVRRGVHLVVSDLERTVLDCLNRPDLAGGIAGVSHIIAIAKPRLNWNRFGLYLDRFGNRSLALRAGFLVERIRPALRPSDAWLRRRAARSRESFVPLGPPKTFGRGGTRDARWHVIENVPRSQLFAEGEIT